MSNIDYASMARLIRKGRRTEKRAEAMQGCITRMIVVALIYLLRGFWLMLGIGILHANWWPALPTIGYWWAVLTVSLLSGVLSNIPPAKAKSGGES